MRRPSLGTLAERDLAVLDRLVVAAMLATLVIAAASDSGLRADPGALGIWSVCSLLLLFRRHRPLTVQLAVLGCFVAVVTLSGTERYYPMGVFAMLVSNYSAGAFGPGIVGLWVAVVGNGTFFALETPGDILFPVAIFAVLPWIAGATLRGNRERARELTELAEQAELETEIEEQRAVLEERRRVARELHDVLAHDLSVIVIQASAAQRMLERSPESSAESAALISKTGREAMAELRHLFGPLHRDGEPAQTPGLAGIEQLVERSNAAGLTTTLRIEGEREPLATGADLAAYRVVQEALTNALKHAGEGATAEVALAYAPGELRLRVADDGVGPGGSERPAAPGGGHGLLGMKERVAVYGGKLEAGRRRDGGFEVIARLPIEAPASGIRAMTDRAGERVGATPGAVAGGVRHGEQDSPSEGRTAVS